MLPPSPPAHTRAHTRKHEVNTYISLSFERSAILHIAFHVLPLPAPPAMPGHEAHPTCLQDRCVQHAVSCSARVATNSCLNQACCRALHSTAGEPPLLEQRVRPPYRPPRLKDSLVLPLPRMRACSFFRASSAACRFSAAARASSCRAVSSANRAARAACSASARARAAASSCTHTCETQHAQHLLPSHHSLQPAMMVSHLKHTDIQRACSNQTYA